MSEVSSKVIGYFAYSSPSAVICTGKACIISGSEKAMRDYVAEICPGDKARHAVRKTRFGEILQGLSLGAAYAFDDESYSRFRPLALNAGLAVADADFGSRKERFFTVQIKDAMLST